VVISYDRRPVGQVRTVRSNAGVAELAANHVIVLGDTRGVYEPDTKDVYEPVLALFDKVGAAYVAAHEKVAAHVGEYQARLASGHDYLNRAASAHVDFVKAVAGARADLRREIADALRDFADSSRSS
jgi:hypothetical protein